MLPALRAAVRDLSWLLTRDYAPLSSAKLVGDRYQLLERQRTAMQRCACSDRNLARRLRHRVPMEEMRDRELWLDGFNVLTALESALGGGMVFRGRDACCRDMAGVHGHYKRVEETRPALELIGRALAGFRPARVKWLLDKPVSNSGRLAGIIRDVAEESGWDWEVTLVPDPDPLLATSAELVATADSAVLDAGPRAINLVAFLVEHHVPHTRLVDLGEPAAETPEA